MLLEISLCLTLRVLHLLHIHRINHLVQRFVNYISILMALGTPRLDPSKLLPFALTVTPSYLLADGGRAHLLTIDHVVLFVDVNELVPLSPGVLINGRQLFLI